MDVFANHRAYWKTGISVILMLAASVPAPAQSDQQKTRAFTLEEAVDFALKNYPAVRASIVHSVDVKTRIMPVDLDVYPLGVSPVNADHERNLCGTRNRRCWDEERRLPRAGRPKDFRKHPGTQTPVRIVDASSLASWTASPSRYLAVYAMVTK
jgi:hypothetical protein